MVTSAYTYNYFLNPEQAEAAQELFMERINEVTASTPEQRREQDRRERAAEEEQRKIELMHAESVDNNISGNMPNGDPSQKRTPKGWKSFILKVGFGCVVFEDFYNNSFIKNLLDEDKEKNKNINEEDKEDKEDDEDRLDSLKNRRHEVYR